MLGKEIRNAAGPDRSFLLDFQQRLPGFDVLVDRGERPVNEIQVEMVESEIIQRRVKGHTRRIIALIAVAQLDVTNTLPVMPVALSASPTSRSL